jgi:acetyl-CoA acetyltransferase family protein
MSRVPLGSSAAGADPYGPRVRARYPEGLVNQGVSAELIAAKWGFSREDLDAYSARSHALAAAAGESGAFATEVVPVPGVDTLVDETVRPATSVESLAGLNPAFRTDALAERFPELDWRITPGNSSPLTDGASAALIMSADAASKLDLVPRARFRAFSVVGSDPLYMLTGVIPATQRVLERAGVVLGDIDAYEVNEAFASVPLAWLKVAGAVAA